MSVVAIASGPFASFLSAAGWSVTYQGFDRGALLRPFHLRRAKQYDAVILQRKLLPGWQLRALRRYSNYLVFDFDDAVKFRDSYDERGPQSHWRSRRFAQTVRRSTPSSPATISLRIVRYETGPRSNGFT